MRLAIDPDTTVGALLEAYPEAEDLLVQLAPAFAKLRNPVVRRTVAKVATLEHAAKIGGLSLQTLILELRAFTGQRGADLGEVPSGGEVGQVPAWVSGGRVVEEVDAQPMLERGIHPIGKIREAVSTLAAGELVLLRTSFRPQPLIDLMCKAGAPVFSTPDADGHLTYFARISPAPRNALRR